MHGTVRTACALALASALVAPAASSITVESVALVGWSPLARLDTTCMTFPSSSADDAMALCSANGTVMQSVTGGGSWEHCTAEGKFVAENAIGNDTQRAITGTGVPTGYTKGEGVDGPAWIGPFTSTSVDVVSADRATKAFNFTRAAAAAEQITWDAPPNGGLVLFSPASGGTVALDDSGLNFIATPWLWYGDTLPVAAGKMCCNGSVVAYATSDGGRHWEYRSEILSKQSLNKLYASEEGPNENDIVRLSDDSLLVVIRKDGGDGVPHHYHVPYVFASSTDKGHTWSIREAPKGMLSARPRAVSLSGGATFIAGGRPGLDLWISQDATAATIAAGSATWTTLDIPTQHNTIIKDPTQTFCPEFENATASLGWAESSAYTQVLALSADTALVCYERQGAGSGGFKGKPPPACSPKGSQIFCMRLRVAK